MTKKSAGFSVPELMIVVGILLILAGITLPSVKTVISSYRLGGDAEGIAAQLYFARMQAASSFTTAESDFDTSNRERGSG